MAFAERDFLGLVCLKDITAAGTSFMMPSAVARPRNPLNKSYMPCIDKSAFPAITVLGKRSPTITVATYWKSTYISAALINALAFTRDSAGNNHTFSCGLYQATAGTWRVYDGCKLTQLDLSQQSAGGPISVQMSFDAIQASGGGEDPNTVAGYVTPTVFTASAFSPEAGQLADVSKVDFGGTADQLHSWRLSLIIGQAPQNFIDGTLYAASVESAMFSGVLTVQQSASFTTRPSTAATLNINGPTSTTGASFSMLLSLDEATTDKGTGLATTTTQYSLIDTSAGGNPCVVTAL